MKIYLHTLLIVGMGTAYAHSQTLTFNEIIAFGDSLSDAGNLHQHFPQWSPIPPYSDGRYSNGPNWIDRLAERVGAEPLVPSELGGNNYAWGGATARGHNFFEDFTGDIDIPDLSDQTAEFFDNGGPINDQLVTVWAGHNDFWAKFGARRDADLSADSVAAQVISLLDAGVQSLLVLNLSVHERIGVSFVPEFNLALADRVDELRSAYPTTAIYEFDYSAFMDLIVADPALFGLTEPLAPACRDCGLGSRGVRIVRNPDEHFFWDDAHISAKGNQLLADAVYRQFFALPGDLNLNGAVDAEDIDLLSAETAKMNPRPWFDLSGDELVDEADRVLLVESLVGSSFGDADLNGKVEFFDFLALADAFGGDGGWAHGDFDGSGDIAFTDFLVLSNNFGHERVSPVGAVPEPHGFALLLLGLICICHAHWAQSGCYRICCTRRARTQRLAVEKRRSLI